MYKAGRGLFRHVFFKETQNQIDQSTPPIPQIRETDFYTPFAEFLKNDLGECTTAIPLGGRIFGDKWGTPDVIGVEMSNFTSMFLTLKAQEKKKRKTLEKACTRGSLHYLVRVHNVN